MSIAPALLSPRTMRRNKAIRVCLPVIIFLLSGCGPSEGKQETAGEQAVKVRVKKTERVAVHRQRSFAGTALAAETVPLAFEVGGKIRSIRVNMGDRVEAGEVVARLETEDYRLQAQRRESEVDRAKALLDRTRSDYRRIKDLHQQNHASRSKLDRAEAEYRSAKASLRESKKALELARKKVRDCELTTERAGRISRVPVEEQQNVRAGQTVAVLSRVDRMQLRVFVPEKVITRIEAGDRANAKFRVLSEESFPARVDEVGVEASRTTTYPVRLTLLREPEGLRPGMVGRALFNFPAMREYIVLPASAVMGREGGKAWVWVLDPDQGRVRRRPVQTGDLTEQGLIIRDGLRGGEKVVLRGASRLEPGQKVRPMSRDTGEK